MNHKDHLAETDFAVRKGKDKQNDSTFMVPGSEGSGNVSEGVNESGGPTPKQVNMQSSGFDSREIEARAHGQGSENIGTAGSASSKGVKNFTKGDKQV